MSIPNVSYDDFDDVISMVNNGYNRRREEDAKRDEQLRIKREKEVNGAVFMIDEALKRSIREEDWRIEIQKRAERTQNEYRENVKKTIIAVLIGAAIVSPFAIKAGEAIINKVNHWSAVNSAVAAQSNAAKDNLLLNGLAYVDESKAYEVDRAFAHVTPFTIRDNSVDDYRVLNVKDYVDVYVYKTLLTDSEFNDFIKSVSYVDGNGNVCRYVSFEQFLKINGFPDEMTFENYAREGAYDRENSKHTISNEGVSKGGRI